MKRIVLLGSFCFVSSLLFAQIQMDRTLQMIGTFPDNQIIGAGAVGIGTVSPVQKIDVVGGDINVDASSGYRINNTGTSGQYLRGNGTRFVASSIQAGDIPSGNGNYIQNQVSADQTAGFRVSGDGFIKGNVGIGTSNPQAKLNVIGSIFLGSTADEFGVSAYTVKVLSGSSAINSGNGRDLIVEAGLSDNTAGRRGGHLYLRAGQPQAPATGYGNVVITDQGGNTGIGTSSPLAKLDVLGANSDVAGNHHVRVGTNFGYRVDATTGQNLILESNNSGTWSPGVTVNRGTNYVGIGTTAPVDKLSVHGGNIRVVHSTAGIDLFNDAVSHRGYLRWTGGGLALFNRDNSPIFFGTTDSEKMRIDAVGNVSIGGHTPNTRLDLGGTSGNKPLMRFGQGSNTGVNYVGYAHNDVLMGSYIGSNGYPQSYFSYGYLQDPNRVFHFGGASDANFNASTSFVSVFSVGAGGSADVNNGNEMRFHTSTSNNTRGYIMAVEAGVNGSAGPGAGLIIATSGGENIAFKQGGVAGTTIMSMTSANRMGIGTVSPGGQLELSLNEGRKPGSNVWTIVSDERLKNINGEYTKGLAEILQLNPITYHYKNGAGRTFDERVLQEQFAGFTAQDLQKVFPECVNVDDDGYLSVDMHAMFIAYVNAFKEQQAQIDQLKKENAELKASTVKMNELNERLDDMDALRAELENLKSYLQQQVQK